MYLGIDLGTSGIKVLLIDGDQNIVATTDAPLEVSRPNPGWSEQDPDAWIEALKSAIEKLKTGNPLELAAVVSIGLSGQMHGATLLGKDDNVLRPCMLWNDTRSHIEASELDSDPDFRAISGNIVFAGFTAPKVKWVQNHEPELFANIKKILLPKDYLRLWLTGEHVSDMSDASGTSWLDVGNRTWSQKLLDKCDLDQSQMPLLVEGNETGGLLRKVLADAWGIAGSIPVAGGGGDNAASAVGMGIVEKGNAFVSLGTSGVVFAASDEFLPRPESSIHAFCHALDNKWHQMGVILSASDALSWYSKQTGVSADKLTMELGDRPEGPSGVLFLPYLSGERTPHNDANIRGAFMGIGHESDRAVMSQSVLEGVSYALRDNLAVLKDAGTKLDAITAVGGGSRSRYWLQLLATILQVPVIVPKDGEYGAAFGAARLAMLAASEGDVATICKPPETQEIIEPDMRLVSPYEEGYAKYRTFYEQIKGI